MIRLFTFLWLCTITGEIIAQPCAAIEAPALAGHTQKEYTQKLQEARSGYEKDTMDTDALLWYGRRLAYLGQYLDAIAVFTKGIRLHPEDARMYRHRGHRYITIRCLDLAVADFTKAAALIKGKPDETEPDGLPNAQNIPTSTLQSNIWYHLGLAYFLQQNDAAAEKAWRECLLVAKNNDMYVATANWLNLALLAQNNLAEAEQLYKTIDPGVPLIENADYLRLLLLYTREKPATPEAVAKYAAHWAAGGTPLSSATAYFGLGYYCHWKGFAEQAKLYFEKAKATGQWASFGYIAAASFLEKN